MAGNELSNFSYVTKVEKGKFTDISFSHRYAKLRNYYCWESEPANLLLHSDVNKLIFHTVGKLNDIEKRSLNVY